MISISEFQQRIYAAASRIPAGKVATYAAVARAANCRSARAAGQALRRNPYAPGVPCHRVIKSDLSLGGFNGRCGLDTEACQRKMELLKSEGVLFDANGFLLERSRLYDFES